MEILLPMYNNKAILGLLLTLSLTVSFCCGDQRTAEVIGTGECADCHQINVKNRHALKGLKVTIDCKLVNGEVKTRGVGELNEEGRFRVDFPQDLIDNGKLKEECYAQLHSASNTPCPSYNSIESSKITFVSKSDEKHTLSPIEKLKFSSVTCTSAFLWPFFKYPPLPKLPPFPKKSFPKKPCPPFFKKPFPHIPIYKKPLPPPIPIYKKPLPPPVPIYKEPLSPSVPIYKKPLLKFKKPCPSIFKKPYIPIYKPKPLPPLPKLPHFPKKKPCPPIPKLPKFPPKFFDHVP